MGPKQKFFEYVRSLGLEVEDSATYNEAVKLVERFFTTDETPLQIEPMLAYDATEDPSRYWDDAGWVAEEKLDGVRMLMHFHQGQIRLTTRGRDPKKMTFNENTANYPQFQALYASEFEGLILDGEMVGGEKSDRVPIGAIQAINGALSETAIATQREYGWARYFCFDVVRLPRNYGSVYSPTDGERVIEDIQQENWNIRRAFLEKIKRRLSSVETFFLTEVVRENKEAFYDSVVARHGEGVMLKRCDGLYKPNSREKVWLKVKKYDDIEATIVGWSPGGGRLRGKVGAVTVAIDGKVAGAFGAIPDTLRAEMTAENGSLREEYYGRRVLVRYQPPLKGLMRHCRLRKFIEETK